jgi:Domain of unknown function (DUF4436)
MALSDKLSVREIVFAAALLVVFGIAMFFTLNVYRHEGEQREAVISQEGEKNPNHVEIFVKMLTIDALKGDATARIEFVPHGSFANEDGSLAQPLKFFVNSANGKQETDFQKGKRMVPVEAVINMYGGSTTDYPFDDYDAFVELYFTRPKADEKKKPDGGESKTETPAPDADKKDEAADPDEVPLSVDFYGSIAGYKITSEKSKDSDGDYVGIDVGVERSGTVKFFSMFVAVLMWVLTISVLFMVLSLVFRGRKPELAMFSFMAALLFAFYTVRNSQPNVPPVGVYSDFFAFFWAEIILGCCLITGLITWLLRSQK